ncbi:hypothetical protein HY570_00085, partial [Candidatus Micrarchaeota archaeon]|nr:hypothetical protein [Candidatus Micrarchaeota archaeon]
MSIATRPNVNAKNLPAVWESPASRAFPRPGPVKEFQMLKRIDEGLAAQREFQRQQNVPADPLVVRVSKFMGNSSGQLEVISTSEAEHRRIVGELETTVSIFNGEIERFRSEVEKLKSSKELAELRSRIDNETSYLPDEHIQRINEKLKQIEAFADEIKSQRDELVRLLERAKRDAADQGLHMGKIEVPAIQDRITLLNGLLERQTREPINEGLLEDVERQIRLSGGYVNSYSNFLVGLSRGCWKGMVESFRKRKEWSSQAFG